MDVALMDRMGCTYQELQETPNYIVEDYKLIMEAEAEGHRIKERRQR
jgi:hypothetical protein